MRYIIVYKYVDGDYVHRYMGGASWDDWREAADEVKRLYRDQFALKKREVTDYNYKIDIRPRPAS